jgi:predicted Kef-type K+ transport protein
MIITDWVHAIAGAFILISLALGTWVHPYWYFLAAFVGANLFQYGFSGFCPLATILKKLGVPDSRSSKECRPPK